MHSLSESQSAFAGALRDARRAIPEGVKSPRRAGPVRRFNVHRNNVRASLIAVLRDRFPVVSRLVGDAFFTASARLFVERHPPLSPVLLRYGAGFPDFLKTFEPAAGLLYLADVARLEWAWSQAYHAADAAPLGEQALRQIAPDDAGRLRFSLHPSLHVVRSQWPVVTIWSANSGEDEPGPVDLGAGGEDALILRPALEVLVHRLPPGGAAFIEVLAADRTLGEAAVAGAGSPESFDLEHNLTGLLRCGAVVGLETTAGGG